VEITSNNRSILSDYTFANNSKNSHINGATIITLSMRNLIYEDYSNLLFCIKFDIEIMKYHIIDLFSGIPTFYKIQTETMLLNNSVINIGDSYVYISFFKNDAENFDNDKKEEMINIKIFNKLGQLIHDPINFQQSKSIIRIGRSSNNEIHVSDATISNTHCSIQYDNVVGWTIRDGYCPKSVASLYTPSSNGTWLFLNNKCKISNGMIFKSGNLLFEAEIEDTDNTMINN
jgi:hypothetical protein